jgi:hypothetical protein
METSCGYFTIFILKEHGAKRSFTSKTSMVNRSNAQVMRSSPVSMAKPAIVKRKVITPVIYFIFPIIYLHFGLTFHSELLKFCVPSKVYKNRASIYVCPAL